MLLQFVHIACNKANIQSGFFRQIFSGLNGLRRKVHSSHFGAHTHHGQAVLSKMALKVQDLFPLQFAEQFQFRRIQTALSLQESIDVVECGFEVNACALIPTLLIDPVGFVLCVLVQWGNDFYDFWYDSQSAERSTSVT